MNEYIIITSNCDRSDLNIESLDTVFNFYRDGKIDKSIYMTKDDVPENYVKDNTEGLTTKDFSFYQLVVEDRSQIINSIAKLINMYYDFDDFSIILLWHDADEDLKEDIKKIMGIRNGDERFQFLNFEELVSDHYFCECGATTGEYYKGSICNICNEPVTYHNIDLEMMYYNHKVASTLYEDTTDAFLTNIAHSELLQSLLF